MSLSSDAFCHPDLEVIMLLTICLTVLITILCLLFGFIVGVKFYDLFGWRWIAAVGPVASLAIGIGFGIKHLGLTAGIIAGVIGALGCGYALFKDGN
jgi:hypothetical protein